MTTTENGESKPFRIIIVGGGICGLSAVSPTLFFTSPNREKPPPNSHPNQAIALRGPNRTITILEQSSFLREIGAAISLQPNASKILSRTWNLSPAAPDAPPCPHIVDRGFRIYSTDGALVNEIPITTNPSYGADRIIYHRRDLHALLLHAATTPSRPHAPASIRLATRVTAADPHAGTVTLATGATLAADLVVAADGIRSALRGAVLGADVAAVPTGLAAYRFVVPVRRLRGSAFAAKIDPGAPFTSMVMGWDRRLVMGPCRTVEGEDASGDYAVVALVPDGCVAEDAGGSSWTSEGSVEALREAYKDFPGWVTGMFELAGPVGLWQLRDLEPLERWRRGRVVLVGDAAHAMLPTQGQGASQSVEDAEALGAMFEDVDGWVAGEEVERRLDEVVKCRYERATLIQAYSRQAARPATNGKNSKVTL